jgi:hypothetical protein
MKIGVGTSKLCILLTATIDPKGIFFMQRVDPLIRENDYLVAVEKWINETAFPIVFCENSGYNINKIEKVIKSYINREFELIQFFGQDFPRELGKGYGELLTIRYAVQHSNLIRNSDYVIKVNGRYFIKNIKKITQILLLDDNIYVMVDLKRNLTFADSRVFAFKPSFVFDYLSKYQDMINDSKGVYLEHILARATLKAISEGHKWIPLPYKPIIIGCSGTYNTPYKTSIIRWLAGEVIHRIKNYLNEKY